MENPPNISGAESDWSKLDMTVEQLLKEQLLLYVYCSPKSVNYFTVGCVCYNHSTFARFNPNTVKIESNVTAQILLLHSE